MRRVTMVDGLAEVAAGWTSTTFRWALADNTYVPDEVTDLFIDAITGSELAGGGYARQTMTTPTVAVFPPATVGDPGFLEYLCDNPDFGTLTGGGIAAGLVLFADLGADAVSPIVAVYPVSYTAAGLFAAEFVVSSLGAVTTSTVCPSGF